MNPAQTPGEHASDNEKDAAFFIGLILGALIMFALYYFGFI